VNQDFDTPDSLDPEGTFAINAPDNDLPVHGSRLRPGRDVQGGDVVEFHFNE
jgi:hypothetical protein